jgi:transposase
VGADAIDVGDEINGRAGVDRIGRSHFVFFVQEAGVDVEKSSVKAPQKPLRGTPLAVLAKLLDGGHRAEIEALFTALVARTEVLEMALVRERMKRNRSERVSADQLDIFLHRLRTQEQTEADVKAADDALATKATDGSDKPKNDPKDKPEEKKKHPAPVRRPIPPGLRRVDNPIVVPDAERACPKCDGERRCIGHDVTEIIDLIPAEVIVRIDSREVLACKPCDGEIERAPMGDKVIVGGAYGSQLVGEMVVDKYWDSMPLYRIGQKFERMGLSMPSSSMADQIAWATDLLRPLWWTLIKGVAAATVVHIDATSLPVRDVETKYQVVLGSLWGLVLDEQHALFLYTSTGKKTGQRPGEIGPEDLLRTRKGYVVADASSIFEASFARPDLIEVGCNMHARRYYVAALKAGDARAAPAIKAFQTLYEIEASIADDADDDERKRVRQLRSKPIYDELVTWARTRQLVEPPSSLLGAALRYLLNHRVALMRFLDDGVLPIDNGIVERLHRRPAVGRRNFLFAGSHAGGERAAIAYSILASCNLADVNPVEYLADILPRLTRDGITVAKAAEMLPAAWKRARDAARAKAAEVAEAAAIAKATAAASASPTATPTNA